MILLVLAISVSSLAFAVFLARQVLAADEGTPQMQEIASAIKEGAEAFLRRQNRTILMIGLGVAALIFFLYAFVRPPTAHDPASPMNMAIATTETVATANDSNPASPVMNIPAIAMITVSPEIITARPDVAAATSSASWVLRPDARSSRSRRM